MYAKGRCTLERWSTTNSQRTIAALEAIAPNLPASCFAARDDARMYLVLSTLHYLSRNGATSNYHRREAWPVVHINNQVREALNINPILERFTQANIDGLSDNFHASTRTILGLAASNDPVTSDMITAHMAEACCRFLVSLASEPTASALALSTEIYCLTYISIAKQGNITESKLTSICNAVSEETGRAINISVEEIKSFNTSFSPYIDSNNAEAICEGLRQGLANFSLRLCLTMQQAVRSGMTSYWMIWEALTLYTDFDWEAIASLIPQDFRKYSDAVALVGNNQYFGFNSDLRAAKHTNFMSLSWVAAKVLIKSDPPAYAALSRYRGLPAQPKRNDEIQAILDAYVPGVANEEQLIGRESLRLVKERIEQAIINQVP